MEHLDHGTIGEIVATDSRAAAVFETFHIDFCCGGRRSLDEACRAAGADRAAVVRALEALSQSATEHEDVTRWSVGRLIDHIVSTHHAYVRDALPTIERRLAKLTSVHGERHPELAQIAKVWREVDAELSQHLVKEEQVLFPYVRSLSERSGAGSASSPFGTVENPIRMMEREHRDAADALCIIRELTREYTAPADGCTTYRVCMAELADFERDLHRHVHLENNVLFPQAVELEQGLWPHARI